MLELLTITSCLLLLKFTESTMGQQRVDTVKLPRLRDHKESKKKKILFGHDLADNRWGSIYYPHECGQLQVKAVVSYKHIPESKIF